MYLPAWRVKVLPFLLPALLLLPSLHLHPALEHRDGTHGTHTHHAVVHADFFPSSHHDHSERHEGKSEPDDVPPRFRTQISFPALLSRNVAPLAPILERVLDTLALQELLACVLLSSHTQVLARDHAPPVQNRAYPPSAPRSPPLFM
ncbi:MAG: hypothetical protein AB7G75_28395 [Candidatus Binatia bacterium]